MAVEITMEMLKQLRERTGVGMTKCKQALEEAQGDMEKAIDHLRKAGMASAVKKEGRATNEGALAVGETDDCIALVEVNAETDFVVKNDKFREFLQDIANDAAATKSATLEDLLAQKCSKDPAMTIEQCRATLVQSIGENIQIRRVLIVPKTADKSLGFYSHLGGKIVTVVELTGSNDASPLAKNIAMHIAAAAPEYVAPENIPASIVENEKEIARDQIKGKPENIIDKILEGKMNAFYDASCLLRQKYIRDDSVTIAQLVENQGKEAGKPLAVDNFIRWSVGQKI